MNYRNNQNEIVKNLVKVSKLYKDRMKHSNKKYGPIFTGTGFNALIHFVEVYAYERQGAAPAYSLIASEVIKSKFTKNNWKIPNKSNAKFLWERYEDVAIKKYDLVNDDGDAKVNQNCNPMNCIKGVITRLSEKKTSNIAEFTRNKIMNMEIEEAYELIESVKGVGDKITCFYLRDIADLIRKADRYSFESEFNYDDLYFFQPIDIWLNRVGNILINNWKNLSLKDKQKKLVEICREADVSSISFNQGAWSLGSILAGSVEKLERAIKDEKYVRELIKYEIKEHNNWLTIFESLFVEFKD